MSTDRPSPFTIPEPAFQFAEGPATEPVPPHRMTLCLLIRNLTGFAAWYEASTQNIEIAGVFEKHFAFGAREVNADSTQKQFRAIVGIERLREYVYAHYGDELTITTARRVVGDLVLKHKLSIADAESLHVDDAMDVLDSATGYEATVGLRGQPDSHPNVTDTKAVSPAIEGAGDASQPAPKTSKRDPNQPGRDRQDDIIATIVAAGIPLTRSELVDKMKLTTEGKLGHQLAWMVSNHILINIPHREYWPAERPVPE